ncbi:hypothetical protein K435DRAFT_861453 [Dendrothele bispora CBS 962.96]|uniref:Uncharacterized protein n=1 Tax=Dendrothele bispora (strain CBS 962.96) TaxID=1314807 RepID=A0A4S8LWR0_DENBC|nr:hypothetical protein K435DRAFT_861453 [Dendrothele bispora CBS 962.96]
MAESQPSDAFAISECRSEDNTGCGGIFPFKSRAGLCARCEALDVIHKDNPEKQKHFENMPQCKSCGTQRSQLSGDTCGRCVQQQAWEKPTNQCRASVVNTVHGQLTGRLKGDLHYAPDGVVIQQKVSQY